jgi:dipeptidyl aminopeptidase/acylaminoacyl peptidase
VTAQPARGNPDRGLVTSTQSGQYQLYAWDVKTGTLRQLTWKSEGVPFGAISSDGRYVYYMQDKAGDEIGHLVRMPWEGGPVEDLTPEMEPYSAFGMSTSRDGNLIGTVLSNDSGFHLVVFPVGNGDGTGMPRELHRSRKIMFGPALSHGGEIAVLTSTDRSGFQHSGLVAVDTASGRPVAELWEDGCSIGALGFSPLPGDFRLLATSTRTGYTRPFLWDPVSGETSELALPDLSGDVSPLDWSADGKRILLSQSKSSVQRLAALDMTTGELTPLRHPRGFYGIGPPFAAGVSLSNGEILAVWQDSTHPPELVALDSRTGEKLRTLLPGGKVPPGHPWRTVTFRSTDGETIQGWLAVPDGPGPFPTILHTHGGPETQTVEYFIPYSQAWLDHGFAWLAINYRGSTGFGRAFREKIWGNLGHWEIEDMVGARNWLVEQGIARTDQILPHGWSYGGYLTLLAMAKYPDLWAGGLAGTATVDWAMEYEDLSPAMKGYSVALLGGTPEDVPERYEAASPMHYLSRIQAPVLIIQGRHDTRTPARPVEVFEAKMKALGKPIEVHWYDEGHLGGGVEQEIEHQEMMMRFAYSLLGIP